MLTDMLNPRQRSAEINSTNRSRDCRVTAGGGDSSPPTDFTRRAQHDRWQVAAWQAPDSPSVAACWPAQHRSRFAAATTNAGGVTPFRFAHANFSAFV
jgi:hypothetical protein